MRRIEIIRGPKDRHVNRGNGVGPPGLWPVGGNHSRGLRPALTPVGPPGLWKTGTDGKRVASRFEAALRRRNQGVLLVTPPRLNPGALLIVLLEPTGLSAPLRENRASYLSKAMSSGAQAQRVVCAVAGQVPPRWIGMRAPPSIFRLPYPFIILHQRALPPFDVGRSMFDVRCLDESPLLRSL